MIRTNDRALSERLRKKDDVVDELYTAVKLYLTQISREALDERDGRRWADIISFTINLEQVGDIIERVLDRHRGQEDRQAAAASPTRAWRRSATCTRGSSRTCASA